MDDSRSLPPLQTRYVLLVVALALAAWYFRYILLLIFAGVLVAVLLRALADPVHRYTRIPASLSVIVVIVLLLAVVAGIGWMAAPAVAEQADELRRAMPRSFEQLRDVMQKYPGGGELLDWLNFDNLQEAVPDALEQAAGMFFRGVDAVIGAMIVVVVGVFLALNPQLYISALLRLLPVRHRPRGGELLAAIGTTLRRWLLGQLVAMIFVGLMTWLGLLALGVPMALTLGLMAFFLEFIPYFGPWAAAIPGVLVALSVSPTLALWTIVFYVVIQQIESLVISPLAYRNTVRLPPALTITSQVVMGFLAGPLGVLLAPSLAAVTVVLVKMLYIQGTLHDHDDAQGPGAARQSGQ